MKARSTPIAALAILLICLLAAGFVPVQSGYGQSKVNPVLLERLQTEEQTEMMVILTEQADLSGASALPTKVEKTTFVYNALKEVADRTQPPLLEYFKSKGLSYKAYYIQNAIQITGRIETIRWLENRTDVGSVTLPPDMRPDPVWKSMTPEQKVEAIEWNITRVRAPDVWAMGYNGQGMVVGSNDTGVEYSHPALIGKYRGNMGGGTFNHNYNWWDAWGGTPSLYPTDYDGHGTHTTGTMVGDDGGANQIGVAPGAKWVACAGLNLECLEFFLTPWDLNHQNPDPNKAPDAVNNSWYDPNPYDYRPIVLAMNQAGIAVIKSAGNTGPNCSTISNPGYVPEIIATAAFNSLDQIASFSARGPMNKYGATILKPEVAAPGVNVRSSVPGGGYEGGWNGTSMAAPHTTALVALMWSAAPCLQGDVPMTKQIMMETAEAKIDGQCAPFVDHPNDVWGWGILDDYDAVQSAIAYCGGQGGLEGVVTDNVTSSPLEGVNILAQEDGGYQKNTSTNAAGEYGMALPEGDYTVTASLYGYQNAQILDVTVTADITTTLNIAMVPLPVYTISGYVTDALSGDPLIATVELTDAPVPPVTTDPSGFYSIQVAQGTWHLKASADSHLSSTVEVVVAGNVTQDFALEPLPCILLVDDDQNDPDVRSYYTSTLDDLGAEYSVWDLGTQGSPDAEDLIGYKMVLWFTGKPWSDTFTSANETAVAEYLDSGGNFFLSSEDYLYDAGSVTSFGQNYLKISSYTNDVNRTDPRGIAGDPIGDGLGPYTLTAPSGWGTIYSDNVYSSVGTSPFEWAANGNDNSTRYDSGTFKTVFIAWPVEGLANLANRSTVMGNIIEYFGGCACTPPSNLNVTITPSWPVVDQAATFAATANGSQPITFTWDFGDGSGSATGPSVTHTYSSTGEYQYSVSAVNACGQLDASDFVNVGEAPSASFTVVSDVVLVDEEVSFTNTSTGSTELTYAWDFGDGSPVSTELNPVHTFTEQQDATVTLTVENNWGQDTYEMVIHVGLAPQAAFSFAPTIIHPEELVAFTNESTGTLFGGAQFTWDFGDGSPTSSDMDATHAYTEAGEYVVTLNLVTLWGDSTVEHPLTVGTAPVVEFTIPAPVVGAGSTVEFTSVVTGNGPFEYAWDFGDGSDINTEANPAHVFETGGTYHVVLTVTSPYGVGVDEMDITVNYMTFMPVVIKSQE